MSLIISQTKSGQIFRHLSFLFAGNKELDQIVKVLLGTAMLVGGMVGCILDNTVPGKK